VKRETRARCQDRKNFLGKHVSFQNQRGMGGRGGMVKKSQSVFSATKLGVRGRGPDERREHHNILSLGENLRGFNEKGLEERKRQEKRVSINKLTYSEEKCFKGGTEAKARQGDKSKKEMGEKKEKVFTCFSQKGGQRKRLTGHRI